MQLEACGLCRKGSTSRGSEFNKGVYMYKYVRYTKNEVDWQDKKVNLIIITQLGYISDLKVSIGWPYIALMSGYKIL